MRRARRRWSDDEKPRIVTESMSGLDETSKQMIKETRAPIPAAPGRKARHDYEYERNGVANLFMMFAPLKAGVTSRSPTATPPSTMHMPSRTCPTRIFRRDEDRAGAGQSFNQTAASLYAAFPAAEAWRLTERFEWHYTPKHGSWLDMAESNSAFSPANASIAAFPTSRR